MNSFTINPRITEIPLKRQTWGWTETDAEGNSVNVEVTRWEFKHSTGKGNWNYYLYVPVSLLANPEEWEPKFDASKPVYAQFDDSGSRFHDIEFHGGVTYCKTETIGTHKCIKVGCDYGHFNDREEGMDDFHEEVFYDAKQTAHCFLSCNPYKPKEGVAK